MAQIIKLRYKIVHKNAELSTLQCPEVHIRATRVNVNAQFVWCLAPIGITDMLDMHVVLKIVHVYIWM